MGRCSQSPHVSLSGLQNPANFCLWTLESWKFCLVESRIELKDQNLESGIRIPSSNDKESRIPYLKSWNTETKITLHGVTTSSCVVLHDALKQQQQQQQQSLLCS